MAAGLPGASSPDGGGKTSPKTFSTTRPRSVKTAPEDATNVRHGKSVVAAKAAEAGAGDGPQISYPADAYLPFRPAMRKVFDQIRTEFIVTGAAAKTTGLVGRDGNSVLFEDDSAEGFLWVEIRDNVLTGEFYDKSGTLQFTQTLTK